MLTFETQRLQSLGVAHALANPLAYCEDPAGRTMADLLLEAIHFFNYSNSVVRKPGPWLFLEHNSWRDALTQLRIGYHDALKELLRELSIRPSTVERGSKTVTFFDLYDVSTIPYRPITKAPLYAAVNDAANKARYSARMFLAARYRSPKFIAKLPKHVARTEVNGVKLDEIAPLLTGLHDAMEHIAKDIDAGGPSHAPTYVLDGVPRHPLDRPSALQSRRQPAGAIPWLAAHLYLALADPRTEAAAPRPPRLVKADARFDPIRGHIEAAEHALGALESGAQRQLQPWRRWMDQLFDLEARFGHASVTGLVHGNPQIQGYRFDWGLVLVYLLRAYLVGLRLRILMTALPVWNFYDGFGHVGSSSPNGYVGLCLLEALSDRPLPHPIFPSCVDLEVPVTETYAMADSRLAAQDEALGYSVQPISLVGVLAEWPTLARTSACPDWELDALNDHALLPIIKRPAVNARLVPTASTVTQAWAAVARHSPPIQHVHRLSADAPARAQRPDFYAITRCVRNAHVSQLDMGANLATQLQLFVADHLLQLVSADFQIDARYERRREHATRRPTGGRGATALQAAWQERVLARETYDQPPRSDRKYQLLLDAHLHWQVLAASNRFIVTAGSNAYGGQFPPHVTHRDGRHYDLSMGPDLVPWRSTKAGPFLERAYTLLSRDGLLPRTPEAMLLALPSSLRPNRRIVVPNIYCIEQNVQVRAVSDVRREPKLLVGQAQMRTLIRSRLDRLHGETEASVFRQAEAGLLGTPHFREREHGELAHLGYLCLLMSGPERIVYASPIVHIRCLQYLNQACAAVGIVETAELLTSRCAFAFLPSDHHHHWHLYYFVEGFHPRLSEAQALWLKAGVDLEPFQLYLKKYEARFGVKDQDVSAFCEFYQKLRSDARATAGFDSRAHEFRRLAFQPFVDQEGSGEGLAPAATGEHSRDITAFVTSAKTHLRQVRDLVRRAAAGERGSDYVGIADEMLDLFTYEELLERFGDDPETPEGLVAEES